MKKLMYLTVFAIALGFTSCGSDDGGGGLNCIAETTNITNAIANFDFTDFTVENCNTLKNSLQNYLDSGCAPSEAAEASFRQTLMTLGNCTIQ